MVTLLKSLQHDAKTTGIRLKKITNPALIVVVLLGVYLLATSAFFPLDFLAPFDAKRVLEWVLFTAAISFTVTWTPLRRETIAQLNRLSLLNRACLSLFFLIGIVSSVRLGHPAYALADVAMLFMMMLLVTIVAASRNLSGVNFDRWAVLLLAATGFAVVTQESMGFAAGWVLGTEFNYSQALVHFAHPRFYNQLQTWSVPVIAALPWIFPDRRWIKTGCVTLLGLQWFLLIALAARGTTLSLLTAMAFVALWMPGQCKFWLKYQVTGVLTGIVIYAGILFFNAVLIPASQTGEFYAHSVGRPMLHTSGRSTLWRLSMQDAIKHPVLGTGPTRYACDSELILPAHPHSFPMRILGEWGMIAFSLVFILAGSIGLGFLRNLKFPRTSKQTAPPLQAMLATSLIAGVMHACLSGLLIMPASQVNMTLIAGWSLSLSRCKSSELKNSSVSGYVLIAGMLVACATLLFAIREIKQLPLRTSYSSHYGPMVPGFWQNGRVCNYNYTQQIANK